MIVAIKKGKTPSNEVSVDALLSTSARPLHLSEDHWSYRLFYGIKNDLPDVAAHFTGYSESPGS